MERSADEPHPTDESPPPATVRWLAEYEPAALPAELQRLHSSGALLNVFRAMLRSPHIASRVVALGAEQLAAGSLPPADRELAILAAAACFQAPYVTAQHEPISRAVGLTDSQRAAVTARHLSSSEFDDAQQALLALVSSLAESARVNDGILAAAERFYTDQQMVELVVLVGYYFLVGRVTTVFQVPVDAMPDARLLKSADAIRQPG